MHNLIEEQANLMTIKTTIILKSIGGCFIDSNIKHNHFKHKYLI